MIKKYFPHFLFLVYIVEFIIAGIHPFSRSVWYAENIPIVILVLFIVFLYYRGIRFSNITYLLMFILPFMHTVGGHYTFELVPFDWFNNFFGFSRNMFDRVGHFSVGFYALSIIEYLVNKKLVAKKAIAITYSIFAVAFVAVFYEWIEWWDADLFGGESGAAFLGSQGDIWDAQKDMFMDVLGAVVVAFGYLFMSKKSEIDNNSTESKLNNL
jgi:putative membrane protein